MRVSSRLIAFLFSAWATMLLVPAAFSQTTAAQQPKVLAPHKPVAPRLPYSAPSADSYVPRFLRGGFWMTDAFTKSSVYIRSDLQRSSLTVTPVLYLSNGVKVPLAAVTLPSAGTAVININDGLAAQGIAPYATLSGYVELQYSWPWDALCATVSSVDATHSVIFTFGLNPPAGSLAASHGGQAPATQTTGAQVLEGAWWKEESGVTGFIALSNTTEQPLPATVQVSDASTNPLGTYSLTVSPHGTKLVDLQELAPVAHSLGGLQVTFNGAPDALVVNGALEDLSKGYSAGIPFGSAPAASATSSTMSYAELGLMAGAADPMMHFPGGTVFKPYSVVRNLATQAISVTPVLYWMQSGAALSSRLAPFNLAPLQTKSLDVPSLLALSGLKDFNGAASLVLEVQGPMGSALLASGSVDQSNTYVFEVVPRSVKESAAKNLSYWSTANGEDTMVTLWNPADEAQDLVFTIFFTGGRYLLPVHLDPRATHTFNLSEVIESQIPDSQGNVIPLAVREGSAKISGTQGENEHILVSMDAGTYNVRKATCRWMCNTCDGVTSWALLPTPFATAVAGSTQLALTAKWNTGEQYNVTAGSTWTSSNNSVGTVSSGLVHGVATGSVTIDGFDATDPWYGNICGAPPPDNCPPGQGGGRSAPGNVIQVFFSPNPATIPGGGTGTVTATVSGNNNNTPITLTLSSSGSGSAAFVNGSPTPSTLTITGTTPLTIKGISGSTQQNDVSISATISVEGNSSSVGSGNLSVAADSVKFRLSGSTSALPSPFRLGISSTVNDCNANPVTHDRTQTIQAVITPPWETPNFAIATTRASNGGTLTFNITGTDDANGIITMTVVGTAQSANQGDVQIVATDTAIGTEFSQPVSVIVPSQIATPHPQPSQTVSGKNVVTSACTSPAAVGIGSNDALQTDYSIHMTITVWDQFGISAGDLYAGAAISETLGTTNYPTNQSLTTSSTYTDPVGPAPVSVASLSPSDPRVASWPSQPLLPFPTGSSTQNIPVQVDGFSIGTISNRTWTATSPPNTVTITWP